VTAHSFGQLNIHFLGAEIGESGHKGCYFVIRPFGNYLVFGLDRLAINTAFIKNKGGIYKQLLTGLHQVTAQGKQFFTTFGCSAILPPDGDPNHFDTALRFEVYQTHFRDKAIHYYPVGTGHWIHLRNQAERGILFTDEGLLIENGQWILKSQPTTAQLDALRELQVDVVMPRLFTGPTPYQALSSEIYAAKLADLRMQNRGGDYPG
jgi:hypothetical protein